MENIKKLITEIPNFPKEGVSFKDISGVLSSDEFKRTIEIMGNLVDKPDYWVGIESRGFIFASALSIMFGGNLLLCRKGGKLPPPVVSAKYKKEYGEDILEVKKGSGSVIIVDDVLATGGTILVAEELLKKAGYNVIDKLVLINLKKLNNITTIKSVIDYE
jgi:adenine phosphoribosyltransferase